jgi:hypothetical protein
MAAVSVIDDYCVMAGSASTIAMLKEGAGPQWLDELGLPHLWVDADGIAVGLCSIPFIAEEYVGTLSLIAAVTIRSSFVRDSANKRWPNG